MSRPTYEFGPFSLDLAELRLQRNGESIPLTPRVFDVLRVLVENAGHLVEKERLLTEVWAGVVVEEANLTRAISVLRKTLGDGSGEPYIETIPKRGYRFVAAVRQTSRHSSGADRASFPAEAPIDPVIPPRSDRWLARPVTWIALLLILLLGSAAYTAKRFRGSASQRIPTTASIHRQLTFTGREASPTVSPDGLQIAYVSTELPERRVIVRDVDGSQSAMLFSAPEAGSLRWSPDGSQLMFWARGNGTDGIYVVPRSGGTARRIAGGPFVSCWSPDGSTIAIALFVEQKIRFINTFGDEQRVIALSGTAGWISDLDWSPVHDRLLVVVGDRQRRPAAWSIRPDGSDQTRLLSSDVELSAARWGARPDTVYYFTRANQTISVFKAAVLPGFSGSEPAGAPLISGIEADGAFGLSADATRLVYARAPYYANLWFVEADASSTHPVRMRQLTTGTSIVERPQVSPDGESILCNIGYESRANLYTLPVSGGAPRQVTFLSAFSVGGVWSRDGRSIAFVSNEGGQTRIWTAGADGSSPRPLAAGNISDNFSLAWGPGTRLLYQVTGYRNVQAIEPDNGEQRLLLSDPSLGFVSGPLYSPGGDRIVLSVNGRHRGLWIVDREGQSGAAIQSPAGPPHPNPFPIGWSADGATVYGIDGKRAAARGLSAMFGETPTAATIVAVPLDGRPARTILELPFEEVGGVAVFPDGRRFAVSVYSSRSDVWMVENFDAAASRPIARR